MNATLIKNCALAALAIAAVSCAKEQVVGNNQPAEVSFAIEAPAGISTKAIGDGMTATVLYYQVFDKDENPVSGLNLQKEDLLDGKTTVTFQLVKDQEYNFIFWAQTKESGYYTIDESVGGEGLKKITADYSTNNAANDENRDAFFAVVKDLKIEGPQTQTVKLTRPFAQINVGTYDVISDGPDNVNISTYLTGATSSLSVKQIPTVFSPMDGGVSEPADVTFEAAAIPGGTLSVNETPYEYLSMNYVFAPAERSVYDLSAAIQFDGKEVSFSSPSTPLQRNFRTNIVGSLLTNSAEFKVEVDPGFSCDVSDWDGTTVTEVAEVDGVYTIHNAAELAWVAQQVNNTTNNFSGKTVKLVNNIDLGNEAWTPIGGVGGSPTTCFYGTFDGNNQTIFNLNVTSDIVANASAGLFGGMTSATVKNLTVKNATISSTHYAGVICGYVQCSTISNCKVSNVKVTSKAEYISSSLKWDNGDKVGGIAGLLTDSNEGDGSAVTGCTVENATIQGYRDLGGIVGFANPYFSVKDNKLEGTVIIKVDASQNYKKYKNQSEYDANAYVGEAASTATVSGNTGTATIDYSGVYNAGYSESGEDVALPAGPDMSGEVVNVNAANAQYTLDGAYGSIDGKTINFTESISETLVLGRPNRFAGSNTKYMVGGYTSDASGYKEFATVAKLVEYLKSNSVTPYYTRDVKNVKFTSDEGVKVNSITAASGHGYGEVTSYDYVLDDGVQHTGGSLYYNAYNFEDLTFEGISFEKNANFHKSDIISTINGLTFKDCEFLALSEDEIKDQRLRVYTEDGADNSLNNVFVENCRFNTSYQGIYINHANGVTVKNSTFSTTKHNAIALQSNSGVAAIYGAVVIKDNTFSDSGKPVIRLGNIGADTQFTISGNNATNCGEPVTGTTTYLVIKAESLADGITYNIQNNNWGGEDRVFSHDVFKDKTE